MEWTKEQQQVIRERGSNILVSAAAGSGKTAVLCERIIERLCDKTDPFSLDRLMVMTFTRAAAEEMRERISLALRQRMETEEQKQQERDEELLSRLRRQRMLIKNADICTIDSLCQKLIREYYQELSIDPSFRVGDDGDLRLTRADVMAELLEDKYRDGDADFLAFAEAGSSIRGDEKLSELVLKTYDFIQGDPWPGRFLKRMLEECEAEIAGAYERLPWYRELMAGIGERAMEYEELLGLALELCNEEDGPAAYIEAVEELKSFMKKLAAIAAAADRDAEHDHTGADHASSQKAIFDPSGSDHTDSDHTCLDCAGSDYDRLYRLLHSFAPMRLKAARGKETDPFKKDSAKRIIDSCKDWLKGLKEEQIALPKDIFSDAVRGSAVFVRELLKLTEEFSERFTEAKRDKNILDFADLEHLCLEVLYKEGEEGMEPSEIADELALRTFEILVDEYQDSNMVQEELIRALSAERFGRPDVFMVGDVKQSIYRFRLARPELFMSKYEAYKRIIEDTARQEAPGQAISAQGKPGQEAAGQRITEQGGTAQGSAKGPSGQDAKKQEPILPGIRISLNKNFRSKGGVISAVNDVFSDIMRRSLGGIEYDEEARLHGAEADLIDAEDAVKTELRIIETEAKAKGEKDPENETDAGTKAVRALGEESLDEADESALDIDTEEHSPEEWEALLIASTIKELVNEQEPGTSFKIRDKQSGEERSLRYGDIAILLRAPGSRAKSYVDTLMAAGIPAYADSTTGYFSAPEVELILALLNIIDDPRQDIPLGAVMRSVIGGFSDEELALIRAASSGQETKSGLGDFYDALIYAADLREEGGGDAKEGGLSEKCRGFLKKLKHYRELSEVLSVSRLLDRIYFETGYLDHVSLLPLGRTRVKNLRMLMRRAEGFSEGGQRSVFDFVRYIEMLKWYNGDYGEESAVSDQDDIVRIISIHRSKGLEYPVVILADCARSFNREDRKESVMMDPELGLASDYVDINERIRYPGPKRSVLRERELRESLSEELRILYVAMTRAREKLIITANLKDAGAKLSKYLDMPPLRLGDGSLPRESLLKASSCLDLILLSRAMGCGSIGLKLKTAYELREESLLEEIKKADIRSELELIDKREVFDRYELDAMEKSINAAYVHEEETRLRPKLSVSELNESKAEHYDLDDKAISSDELEDISAGKSGASAGTAYHRLMELMDFREDHERLSGGAEPSEVLEQELSRIRDRGLMGEEDMGLLDKAVVLGFMQSPIFERMARAAINRRLWREQRFMASFPASVLSQEVKSDAPQLLQGVMDAYFEEEGELVIVDYKTDRLFKEEAFRERYGLQLRLYRQSLEQLTDKKVKECLIYSTALGRTVTVD